MTVQEAYREALRILRETAEPNDLIALARRVHDAGLDGAAFAIAGLASDILNLQEESKDD